MKHKLGQYFTSNTILKETLYRFIHNNPSTILEPSIGRGDLVDYVLSKNSSVVFDMYEIDTSIVMLPSVPSPKVIYGDFLQQHITKHYDTIIGNPPYVKTKKGNLYVEFTERCFDLLSENGELIFIVPSDFFKLTHASKLLERMMNAGTFTHIYHPHDETLFEHATIDVVVYRYCKNRSLPKQVLYNDTLLNITNSKGLITFDVYTTEQRVLLGDYFDVYVGIVSGKDEVYKNDDLGNICVLNGDNKIDKYIYTTSFPCDDTRINEYLLQYKSVLMQRAIRKFNDSNWYEWGAPRNIATIEANIGKPCIYVYNMTRKDTVAFRGEVMYFGGQLLMMIPKKQCDVSKVISYINSKTFRDMFMYSGRFKIGQRHLCMSYIPKEMV